MSRFNEPFSYGDDVFILRNGQALLCGRYRSCQHKFLDNSMECSIEFDAYLNPTNPLVPEKVIALCILKKLFGGSKFNDALREALASSNYKDDAELRLAMLNDYLRHEHRKKKHEEAE